jgi:phosphoribosyl-ATP pyrophosphohydrolase
MSLHADTDTLARLAAVIESRKPANGGDPEKAMWPACCTKGPTPS